MKNQNHFRLIRQAAASLPLACVALAAILPFSAFADDGTWDVDADGLWGTTGNWASGAIADGSGFTANFTNDITDDRTISLDSDRTLTNLVFSDSDPSTAGSWSIDDNGDATNNLILAGILPGVTVDALGTGKSATISAVIEGTDGLAKSGAGTLVLTGSNTYTSDTTISGGVLDLSGPGAQIYNSASDINAVVTVNNGGVLVVKNFGKGTGTDISLGNLVNEVTDQSVVLDGGTLRVTGDNGTTRGRAIVIGPDGGAIEVASGSFTMGNTSPAFENSYAANSTVTLSGAATGQLDKLVTGSGVKVTKTGAGTWTLTGANTYTGATTITGGTLSTGLLANGGIASGIGQASTSAANLVINGGTLKYTGGALSQLNRGFTIGLNGATLDRSSGSGQLDFNNSIAYSGSGARSLTVITGSGSVRLRPAIADSGGATSVVKQGAGQLMLTGSNTYTGQLQILQGNVQLGNAGLGGESSGVGHTVAISSGAELRFRHGSADAVTFNADISGAGMVQMNYNNGGTGGGSLTLGGDNTFTGDLLLNPTGGTEVLVVKAGSTTGLGAGNVVFGPYGKLDLNGFNATTGLLRGLAGNPNGIVTNDGASDATLTLASSQTQTYGGVIQDGANKVSIVKDGSGTQSLTGAISYTGDTTVEEGTLSLGQINTANESSTVSIAAEATLNLTFAGTNTVDKLFLGGVQRSPGVYGSGNSGGLITGSGTLTVTSGPAASGFASWIDAFPGVGASDQPGDDPDNDGADNLLEFVLNGDPTAPDASILPTLDASGSTFVFTFTRRDDSLPPENTQTFQYGSDLDGWTDVVVPADSGPAGAATITVTDGSPADTVQISIPKSEAGLTGKLFGRLRVSQP